MWTFLFILLLKNKKFKARLLIKVTLYKKTKKNTYIFHSFCIYFRANRLTKWATVKWREGEEEGGGRKGGETNDFVLISFRRNNVREFRLFRAHSPRSQPRFSLSCTLDINQVVSIIYTANWTGFEKKKNIWMGINLECLN